MIFDRPLVRRAGMIAVLLLTAALILGGLGFGVYLLVRPSSPEDKAAPPPATSTPSPTTPRTEPEPGPDTGSGSTPVRRPDRADPRAVVGDYLAAVNDRDEDTARSLTCQETDPGTLFEVIEGRQALLGEVEVIGETAANAAVRVGDDETALLLENRKDGWCVAI
ncbi:hypothetical protein BLA60_09680 [Actinophytocola xinjiangensis]|uniref:Uncharacterized protein n=1 Tax=Actinophytocola xinjiangensis TaxID=485602 RepID=A0A7Z1AZS2_9PSEU|nr:hypothetical protein [Actinophytocola xinjiangensis]OLF12250.1 hypothetical protein BLA60_09680 [Actinophytocola xinjiangensis]